jgi:conjugal transfer/entry exclusion protein
MGAGWRSAATAPAASSRSATAAARAMRAANRLITEKKNPPTDVKEMKNIISMQETEGDSIKFAQFHNHDIPDGS